MSAKLQAAIAAVSIATFMGGGVVQADQSEAAGTTVQAPPNVSSTTRSAPATYRSAFEGYRGYSDQAVGSWRQTNDTVRQIGGWRAYARESQAPERAAADADGKPAARRDSDGNGRTGHH